MKYILYNILSVVCAYSITVKFTEIKIKDVGADFPLVGVNSSFGVNSFYMKMGSFSPLFLQKSIVS